MRNHTQEVNAGIRRNEHITIGWSFGRRQRDHVVGRRAELSHRTICVRLRSVTDETESERIKRLQVLCDQLEALQKQADEICKNVTTEIRRAQTAGQRERRSRNKKVNAERRKN